MQRIFEFIMKIDFFFKRFFFELFRIIFSPLFIFFEFIHSVSNLNAAKIYFQAFLKRKKTEATFVCLIDGSTNARRALTSQYSANSYFILVLTASKLSLFVPVFNHYRTQSRFFSRKNRKNSKSSCI